jgi:hypothetical protein
MNDAGGVAPMRVVFSFFLDTARLFEVRTSPSVFHSTSRPRL